jgi:DNA adenine methylase
MAARLLYLNRVAYGGIYRVNRHGKFNVPYSGDRNLTSILCGDRLEKTAAALTQARLVAGDFSVALAIAGPRSLIYCDPPYSLPGAEVGFRRYGRVPFAWSDQIRLAEALREAVNIGSTVVVSNSSDGQVQELYPDAQVVPLVRKSALSRRGSEQKEALYILHANPTICEKITTALSEGLA